MKEIITDRELLANPAEPLEFITETGVSKDEGLEIISELKAIMEANPDILALSAPQIGINKRVFGIKFNDGIKFFIDPIIKKKSGGQIMPETCASMPGKEFLVGRPSELTVVYYTDEFKYEDNKLLGPAARLFDQQAQLLDGILPSDLGLESDVEEDGSLADLSEEEISKLTDIYKQYIKLKTSGLKEHLETNQEDQKQYNELKFMEKVISGEAVVVDKTQEQQTKLANVARSKAEAQASRKKLVKRLGK